jgi:chromosome segregation ATPase
LRLTRLGCYVVNSLRPLIEHMKRQTLLANLNAALQEASAKLAQSDLALVRLRQELATFQDILQQAQQSATRAGYEYEKVFTEYQELLAGSAGLPPSYPSVEEINKLSAKQAKTHDEQAAAKELVRKYQEQVRIAELGLALEESNRKSLQKAADDLTWQIKRLSARG